LICVYCTIFDHFPCMCYITLFFQHFPLLRMRDLLLGIVTLNCWTFCNFITRFTHHITQHEVTTELESTFFSAATSPRKQRFFTNAYVSTNISIRHPNKTTSNFL
jgi:hypothetical protein